jgi:glutamate-ammonia-ligase adenylyltransferase
MSRKFSSASQLIQIDGAQHNGGIIAQTRKAIKLQMSKSAVKRTITSNDTRDLPELLVDPATRWVERLSEAHPGASINPEHIASLVKLAACSEFAGNMLIRDWEWFCGEIESRRLTQAPAPDVLESLLRPFTATALEVSNVKRELRIFRNRQMLGILWREVSGRTDVVATLHALSELADALIAAASAQVRAVLSGRFGEILAEDGRPSSLVVLAMGKLGGEELNFSSDIDLIFLYAADGDSNGDRQLSANEYFTRWARQLVSLLDDITEDGFVFRVDTRLRPFGDSGPLVVSFAAL